MTVLLLLAVLVLVVVVSGRGDHRWVCRPARRGLRRLRTLLKEASANPTDPDDLGTGEFDRLPPVFAGRELAERMVLIKRFARALADTGCEACEGEGIDWEGAEWFVCDECVLTALRRLERQKTDRERLAERGVLLP